MPIVAPGLRIMRRPSSAGRSATAAVRSARQASSRTASASSDSASTAAASSAALTAPASPIASVPTGTPAGICTIDSRLSWPDSALVGTGTPNTGSVVKAAVMPGRCAAPPAPATITLKPLRLRALGEGDEPVGRAVGRDDARVVADAERLERLGGAAHHRPVRLAAHDDGDRFRRAVHPYPRACEAISMTQAIQGSGAGAQAGERGRGCVCRSPASSA